MVRRGRQLVFCEVKAKEDGRFGDPLEMVDDEKARRVLTAAAVWMAAHPELHGLELAFEAAGVRGRQVERVPLT